MKYTKADLIQYVADNTELRTKVKSKVIVEAVIKAISTVIEGGNTIYISGFGTFSSDEREAREFVNPRTKEVHQLPKRRAIRFKPAKNLKSKMR